MFLFSVLPFICCKSHFSKPQKGTVHLLTKNTSNSLNSFPATWIPKFHAFILYKSSEGYFLLDTLPIPTGFWRRHNHINYSLCSLVSQITINLNCKSCSVCRAGGARTPWKAFWSDALCSSCDLSHNQGLEPQALRAPLPSIPRSPWPTPQGTADSLGSHLSPGNLHLSCKILALLKILLLSSCSGKLLTLLQALKSKVRPFFSLWKESNTMMFLLPRKTATVQWHFLLTVLS